MSRERIVMTSKRHKLLTCKSLAHVLEPLVGPDTEIKALEIALHVDPQKLKARLMEEVAAIEEEGVHILLGYGLCGRALEGVVSAKSTLVLPKVDDCVGALLGSRKRHKELLKQNAGCYFLEQRWLQTELNIFTEILKGLERIPPDKRDKIIKLTLKHYNTLILLDSGDTSPETESLCLTYARRYVLELIRLKTELGLLKRLITGPWNEEEFLVLPPGMPIPFF
jgi:hypothetical protein